MIAPDHWPAKATPEALKYSVKWTKRLAGAVIATSLFSFKNQAGLVIEGSAALHDDTISTVMLSGGSGADIAEIVCTITTNESPSQTMIEVVKMQVDLPA